MIINESYKHLALVSVPTDQNSVCMCCPKLFVYQVLVGHKEIAASRNSVAEIRGSLEAAGGLLPRVSSSEAWLRDTVWWGCRFHLSFSQNSSSDRMDSVFLHGTVRDR